MLCSAQQLPLTKESSLWYFWEWKIWFTCLIAEVVLWNNPDVFCSYVSFPEMIFSFLVFFSLSCLHMSSLFSVLAPLCCCYLEWKCFSNFTHIFTAITLLSNEEQSQKAKGVPPWPIPEVQLFSSLKQLTSANLRTGEIGEMWVCFRLRGFCINYDLTVHLWWVYSQEESYSRCITGKAWADLTCGCRLRRMAASRVRFYLFIKTPAVCHWVWKLSEDWEEWREDHSDFYICIISGLVALHGVLHSTSQPREGHSKTLTCKPSNWLYGGGL